MGLNVVPISAYCNLSGESEECVVQRIKRKIWQEGIHVLKVDNVRERWIDLEEVNKWARKNKDTFYRGA